MKKVIDREKRSKTLSEVKPFKNISKNLQNFLEMRPVQRKPLSDNPFGFTEILPESIKSSTFVS